MTAPRSWQGWLAAIVVAGLLAMHGVAGDHGSTVMTTTPTLSMPAPMFAGSVAIQPEPTPRPSATVSSAGMGAHAMTLCVALPVTFLLHAVVVGYLTRRRRDTSTRLWCRPVRDARAPPCPPPHVRGVCLT